MSGDPGQEGGGKRSAALIAFVFVVALAAFAIWVVNGIIADVKLQNCVFSGRRDCVPINPDPPSH